MERVRGGSIVGQRRMFVYKMKHWLSIWLIVTLFLVNTPFSIFYAYAETTEGTTPTDEVLKVSQDHNLESLPDASSQQEVQTSTESAESVDNPPSEITNMTGKIAGTVWLDENEDGLSTSEERRIANAEVCLIAGDDRSKVLNTTLTDNLGNYEFSDLSVGRYYVAISEQTLEDNIYLAPRSASQTGDDNKFAYDTNGDPKLSYTEAINITENEAITAVDAGMRLQKQVKPTAEVGLYEVYDETNQSLGSYQSLKAAMDFCNSATGRTFTILLTADDLAQGAEATVVSGKNICLKSKSVTRHTIKQTDEYENGNELAKRHISIQTDGGLTLENIVLEGIGRLYGYESYWATNGGVKLTGGTLILGKNAMITKTFGNKGGAIEAIESSSVYLKSSGKVHFNQSSDTGGGIFAKDSTVVLSETSSVSNNIGQWRTGGINLDHSLLTISNEAAITGNIAMHNEAGGIKAENNSRVTMAGGSIASNSVEDGGKGGGIYADGGSLDLSNGMIQLNKASEAGGGIYVTNAAITASNSSINQNSGKDGAGIYSNNSSLQLSEGTIVQKNEASLDGGGIYAVNNETSLTDSRISDNISNTNGGGIFMRGNKLIVSNGEISSNTASNDGGGIRATGGSEIEMSGIKSLVSKNQSSYGGGISANENSTITVTDGTITENEADQRGGGVNLDGIGTTFSMSGGVVNANIALQCGGVLVDKALADMKNVTFSENQATGNQVGTGYGGGIFVENGGKATVTESYFGGNTAYDGGGMFVSENSQELKISNTTFNGNKVRNHGGGLVLNRTTTELNNVVLENNHADRYGGGIRISDETVLTMINSKISTNIARYGGGLSANTGSKISLTDTDVLENKAIRIANEENESNKGGDGGGINIDLPNTTFTMTGGKIDGNIAESSGGGLIATAQSQFSLINVPVTKNSAKLAHGGGAFLKGSSKGTLSSSDIEENEAAINGGGIRLEDHGDLVIDESSVSKNTAPFGGGISANTASTVEMLGSNSKISENITTHLGGGVNIDNQGTKFTMNEGSIDHNPARNGGGIFASDYAQFIMTGGLITQNTASNNGAGVYLQATALLNVNQGKISANTAGRSGGGIFTEDYDYNNPVNANLAYKNIIVSDLGEVTEDNRSQGKQPIPEITGMLNFNKDYLNDFRVNYSPDSYMLFYHPNGGGGVPDQVPYPKGEVIQAAEILSAEALDYTPPQAGYVFLYWAQNPEGTGTRYSVNGSEKLRMDSDKHLYAIWGPPTTLSGTVFLDKNRNSTYESDEILENREVTLYKKDKNDSSSYAAVETTKTNQGGNYYFAVADGDTYKISVKVIDGEYGKYGFVKKGISKFSSHVNTDGFSDPLLINIENELNPILNAGYIASVVETGVKLDTTNWIFYLMLLLLISLVTKRVTMTRK